MQKNPALLKKKASHYFLKNDHKEKYLIDQQKIDSHQQDDGFLAIATNVTEMDMAIILDRYKHLYQVEHAFRTFKSFLETQPMFHWTDQRIEGHICLCYMAYAFQTFLSNRLKKNNTPLSENEIRRTLDKMQLSLVEQAGQQYYLRSKLTTETAALLKAIDARPLPDIFSNQQIINYL